MLCQVGSAGKRASAGGERGHPHGVFVIVQGIQLLHKAQVPEAHPPQRAQLPLHAPGLCAWHCELRHCQCTDRSTHAAGSCPEGGTWQQT